MDRKERRKEEWFGFYGRSTTVFGDSDQVRRIQDLVNEFPRLWASEAGIICIPKEDWAEISILSQFAEDPKLNTQIYRHSKDARDEIDRVSDQLTAQGKIEPTRKGTPSGFPVFVV